MNWLTDHRHQILRLAKSLAEELKENAKNAEGPLKATTEHTCFYPGCGGNIEVSVDPGERGDRVFWRCTLCNNGGSISLSPNWWQENN
jgi:hypothetical protein